MKYINLVIAFLFLSVTTFAAEEVAAPIATAEPSIGLNTSELLIVALLVFVCILLFITITLFNAFKSLYENKLNLKVDAVVENQSQAETKSKPSLWDKMLGLKPIETEKDIVIPHAYDGIHELNNPVPNWFNVLFYGTIIFAAGYLYYYHLGGQGQLQDQEYETEMAQAKQDKILFLSKAGNSIDENSVVADKALIANGQKIFAGNCVACHGDKGQGLVGPNLTDEFWLHGGDIKDIFKVIKYGVPEKGMVSWEKSLSAQNISELANYIMSLKGSNPAGAKAPQGQKFEASAPAAVAATPTLEVKK
ncbi:MAG: c-type cytochrome [Sphingobacteriaceae bacterium]|nr:c-type cytochrome [Sphingobacteriaceae bacterium]